MFYKTTKTFAKTKTFKTMTNKSNKTYSTQRLSILIAFGVVAAGIISTPLVYADRFQDQINELNQQSGAKSDNLSSLGGEAANLQDKIAKLQAEIANLQAQIQANEAKKAETQVKIAEAEAKLARNKQLLSDVLKSMYVGGSLSSLEMLATSKNLNDFVDQEQYRNKVQAQVQDALVKIKELQTQLATEKSNLERMIADQQTMQATAASQKSEQARLLNLNQSQQAELDNQIKANGKKITELQVQQAKENARLTAGKIPAGVPGGGGYPGVWAFAPIDSKIDSWGMYNRECVSWTAYKVAASGRHMPYWGGIGNANQWDDNARAAGIPVDGNPRRGDVAVKNSGYYGHVMYVEDVAADGSLFVSDYNQQLDGLYRAYWISAANAANNGLVFIHF